jgi:AcrR family transcriptional regulator
LISDTKLLGLLIVAGSIFLCDLGAKPLYSLPSLKFFCWEKKTSMAQSFVKQSSPKRRAPDETRRRAPDEKRQYLLEAARYLFVSQGFEKTTTRQISNHSGVSEGVLFHQFVSKLGLFRALILDYAQEGVTEFLPADGEVFSSEQVIRRVISFVEKDWELFTAIENNKQMLKENDVPTTADLLVPAIEKQLQREQDKGNPLPAKASIMAEFLFTIVETAYRGWLKSTSKKAKEEFVTEGVRCIDAIIAPRPVKSLNSKRDPS